MSCNRKLVESVEASSSSCLRLPLQSLSLSSSSSPKSSSLSLHHCYRIKARTIILFYLPHGSSSPDSSQQALIIDEPTPIRVERLRIVTAAVQFPKYPSLEGCDSDQLLHRCGVSCQIWFGTSLRSLGPTVAYDWAYLFTVMLMHDYGIGLGIFVYHYVGT